MGFELVPEEYSRFKVQHVRRLISASVAATVFATHVYGTGSKMIPIQYRFSGSVYASISLYNGSSGASIWSGFMITGNQEQWGPLWDISATSGGNSIEWTAGVGAVAGFMELWWIVVPDTSGVTL